MPATRELYTMGSMGPLGRTRARRQMALGYYSDPIDYDDLAGDSGDDEDFVDDEESLAFEGMGATNPNFAVPHDATMDHAGGALQDAALALLNQIDTYGVPSMHTDQPLVRAFQSAWNADPIGQEAGAALDVDGGYGLNVQAALNALTGGLAPAPNAGPSPAPAPAPSPAPGPAPPGGEEGSPWPWVLGGTALAALVYFLFIRKKKGGGTLVSIKSNPRRGRGRRRSHRNPYALLTA